MARRRVPNACDGFCSDTRAAQACSLLHDWSGRRTESHLPLSQVGVQGGRQCPRQGPLRAPQACSFTADPCNPSHLPPAQVKGKRICDTRIRGRTTGGRGLPGCLDGGPGSQRAGASPGPAGGQSAGARARKSGCGSCRCRDMKPPQQRQPAPSTELSSGQRLVMIRARGRLGIRTSQAPSSTTVAGLFAAYNRTDAERLVLYERALRCLWPRVANWWVLHMHIPRCSLVCMPCMRTCCQP